MLRRCCMSDDGGGSGGGGWRNSESAMLRECEGHGKCCEGPPAERRRWSYLAGGGASFLVVRVESMAEVRAGTHVSLPEEARGFFSVLMRLGHLDVGYCCFLIGPVDTCRAPEAGDQASDPPGDAQHYPKKKAGD
jgi:hypothetical protein